MKYLKRLAVAVFMAFAVMSCQKEDPEVPIFVDHDDDDPQKDPDDPEEELASPLPCSNNIVAHRGGSSEAGKSSYPDNSLEALKYTMSLKCMAMECDMLWTKDNNVIIYHPTDGGLVNKLVPGEHTLKEIRNAGKLSNGKQIPTLEDFLDVLMADKNCCTKLWIETKNLTNESTPGSVQEQYMINAVKRAIEIINEKKANNFVEFNGTGSTSRFRNIAPIVTAAGFKISYAAGGETSASTILNSKGAKWANYDVTQLAPEKFKGLVEDYEKNKVELSVYNIDTPELRSMVLPYKDRLKGILTNYPKAMLNAIK